MTTPPLLMLYAEWLRQGSHFPMMEHMCRYFSYTHQLEEVHYYQFAGEEVAKQFSFPAGSSNGHRIQAQQHTTNEQKDWYTLPSGPTNFYYLNVRDNEKLIGLYQVTCNLGEPLPTMPAMEWLVAALQWEHQSRWLLNEDWKFAYTSSERWMVVTDTGVDWFNPSIEPWFRTSDKMGEWPAWVHQDAVIRNAMFWEQMESKNNWTGMVSGNMEHPSTWWYIQKLDPKRYLVRVNTYEELTTNLLAQSHWQRHDPLTALAREMQMQWHWKGTGEESWSIALITMDHFYKLNHSYGAENVDKGLLEIAAKLREVLPPTWSLWRGRAEQFYAMGPSVHKDWFISVLRMEISESPLAEVTTSVGIGTDTGFANAKKLAQEAAEQAISKGGRQLILNSYPKRIRCLSSLKESMSNIEVEKDIGLVYDPIYKNQVIGFRLHTNWNHPTWGVIKGNDVLPYCEEDIRQDYVYWVVQQLITKAAEWKTLGLSDTHVLWPLPGKVWTDSKVQDILNRDWNTVNGPAMKKIFEIEERDALADFDVLEKYHKEWKSRGLSLCISLQHSTDINILKLLQLHPDYVSLPWPFARNASVHKAVTEVISFVLNRGIKVIAYCPHGVGAPQLFSGVVQQKPYH